MVDKVTTFCYNTLSVGQNIPLRFIGLCSKGLAARALLVLLIEEFYIAIIRGFASIGF